MLIKHKCPCGKSFFGGPRAIYCPACRQEKKREYTAAHIQRKRKGQARELGSTDTCIACGREYEIKSSNQRYCPDCAPTAVAAIDRQQGLEYYYTKKHKINPSRSLALKKARQGPHLCEMCGQSYVGLRGDGCCSLACRAEKKRLKQAQYDAKRSGKPIPEKAPLPRKIDWSTTDWSMSNKEISELTGLKIRTVWAARKRLAPDQA